MNTIMPLGIMLVNQIHNCDKEEFLFQNWEFYGPWVRGSGVRTGSNDYIEKIHEYFKTLLLCSWI